MKISQMKKITADNAAFTYMGRIDGTDPSMPLFIYAGSMVKVKFTGTIAGVFIKNVSMSEYSSVGYLIDGVQGKIDLSQQGEEEYYQLADNLEDKEHELVVFKRQAAANYFYFCGIGISKDGDVSKTAPLPDFKLEVYGDSVSAGEVVENIYYEAHSDPENHKGVYDNAWFSYTLSLSRKLNAQIHNCSQGGISLFDKTGYFYGPDHLTGLETTYDKLSYVPYAPMGLTKWDFGRYTPDLVIIAIGQNDASPDPDCLSNPEYKAKWQAKYSEILRDLQSKYGEKTRFLLITTVLMHDKCWDNAIDEIAESFGENVHHYMFKRNGAATPGHPRITEQEEMAGELNTYIRNWFNM